ncbi:hypothetical protein [Rhodanobacter sp. FW106-PBR-LB-2-11]|uniref:hypothetical protein n=1 Tax=Rhodanobacter sp. FW106-PBR-LB-2-11 TaxID=1524463 RepID=UPI0034E54BA2
MNLSPTHEDQLRAVFARHGVIAHRFEGVRLLPGLSRPVATVVRGHVAQRTVVERLLARGERRIATWIKRECPSITINGRGSVIVQYDCRRKAEPADVVKLIELATAMLAFAEHAATAWLVEQGAIRVTTSVFSLAEIVRMADANDGLIPASISASLVLRARVEHCRARGRGHFSLSTGLTAVPTLVSTWTSIHPSRVSAPNRVNDRAF